jgi:sulfate transport system ATP-binding protein
VFQHYALFRHMTVFENIAFGLRARPRQTRPSEAEIRQRVNALLDIIQLDWISKRYPDQLSGGQRQRVALARVLAVEPRVLLLDEPFGALDTKVRIELRHWLRERHADLGVTTLFVTHDQDEALEVSDRVVVINAGRVEQAGTPDEVYHCPQTPFVCRFLGAVNVLSGQGDGSAPWYVRPHEIDLVREPGAGRQAVTVTEIHTAGPLVRLTVALNGRTVEVAVAHNVVERLAPRVGEVLYAEPRVKRRYAGQPGMLD